jgi:hypothetical protein
MNFVENLFILRRLPWRGFRMVLQLVDQARKIGVMQPFLERSLAPIWYNEGEGKDGPLLFILSRKRIINHIFFSLLVNYLIIISKYLGHPFLLLQG